MTDFTRRLDPYQVDAPDSVLRGRLLFAASRGDHRARATLKAHPRTAPPEAVRTSSGSVNAGRAMARAENADRMTAENEETNR